SFCPCARFPPRISIWSCVASCSLTDTPPVRVRTMSMADLWEGMADYGTTRAGQRARAGPPSRVLTLFRTRRQRVAARVALYGGLLLVGLPWAFSEVLVRS